MQVTILFFSSFKNLAGVGEVGLDVDDHATIADLLPVLARRFPELPLEDEHLGFIVNGRIAGRDQTLQTDDRVTVFEMFAGG